MSFNTQDNPVFHERVGKYARMMQNLREEGERLRTWYFEEVSGNANFVDTPQSTTAECIAMINYMEDFRKLNENESVSANTRRLNLVPFLDNDSQI